MSKKNLSKLKNRRWFFNTVKSVYEKPITSITVNVEMPSILLVRPIRQ
jgi:hypothetical protein